MPQPTIINAGNDNTTNDTTWYGLTEGSSRSSETKDITIPANAKTVCIIAALDGGFINSVRVDSVTVSGLTVKHTLNLEDYYPNTPVGVQHHLIVVLDVSDKGALTPTVTVNYTAATTEGANIGVLCVDGYLVSSSGFGVNTGMEEIRSPSVIADPENTTLVVMGCSDALTSAALTGNGDTVVEFKSTSSGGYDPSIHCLSQKTFTNGYGIVSGDFAAGQDMGRHTLQFHSSKPPFQTRGGMIKDVVR